MKNAECNKKESRKILLSNWNTLVIEYIYNNAFNYIILLRLRAFDRFLYKQATIFDYRQQNTNI